MWKCDATRKYVSGLLKKVMKIGKGKGMLKLKMPSNMSQSMTQKLVYNRCYK